jgi:hypothetical protein
LNSDPQKKLLVSYWLISATPPEINHLQAFARSARINRAGIPSQLVSSYGR